ncbi:MAG: N-formylglutamate deformylase [Hyphomicrobiales bacterium]|nr:N-formylglutamate deformylase [Hyphomicrobiales bacterium]MCP5372265.1 N-formylglutamate deformylase [Hyphomicrobiales bacterium]
MTPVTVIEGSSPVILGQPHGGTRVPAEVWDRLNDTGRGLSDTDWHIGRLYDGLLPGATVVRAEFHRYVIDANRDPSGASLYPGQNTTGLCPLTDFDGRPLYIDGSEPDADEIAGRRARYHAPYHAALAAQVARVKAIHGRAVLFDCHSIRSLIPFLFEGRLPVFNIGTNNGATCAAAVAAAATEVLGNAGDFDMVLNGRFKGGWTTRHYGDPESGVHAIQLEMAQYVYMQETAPWDYLPARADEVRPVLGDLLRRIEALARDGRI